ncbi:MAG: phosphatidylserine/phosphatidylglycerophosphate/cardiolipin synthase family protein [Myxococcales bacterium FL481]|nr:MAG: phosphatidylserine/phosphatidylglycerophosphate/cardiolipin synthase family protein [Myxococcales bacterium FL481]
MSGRPKPVSNLRTRIHEIAANLAPELRGQAPPGSLIETATNSLASTVERIVSIPAFERLAGGVRADVLTGPGERLELSAQLGVTRHIGDVARFYLDDRPVADVVMAGQPVVHAVVESPGVGLHEVRVKVLDGRGSGRASLTTRRTVQVVARRPVALVDAGMFCAKLDAPTQACLAALRELAESCFELAYVDVSRENRYSTITEAIARHGLPPGAIVIHATEESEMASLGVDLVSVLGFTAVRRLRAQGVAVTAVLSKRFKATQESAREQIMLMSPKEALRWRDEGGLVEVNDRVARFFAERDTATRLDWWLDRMTESRAVGGNRFHAELDNAAARQRIFDAITRAQRSVHVQAYILRPSRFTDRLIVELIRRARAGIKVRMMVDALYSDDAVLGRMNDSLQSLRGEANAEVIAVDPIPMSPTMTLASFKQRDHRKLFLIDDEIGFVSGRNASDEYYLGFDEVPIHDHTDHERIPWLDAHVELTGPLVQRAQCSFAQTWREQGGAPFDVPEATAPRGGGARGRFVVHRGLADTNGLGMYEAMFEAAESHAYIVNDFPFVPTIERAVLRLLTRGVRVVLLTGSATARRCDGTFFPALLHRTLFEYMVKGRLEPMLLAGVEAFEYVPPPSPLVVARGGTIRPYVHAKVVSIDGRASTIGSANLDATASYWESEANVVIEDEAFATDLERQLEAMIARSVRLDPGSEYWQRERAQRAVVSTLWPGSLYS